MKLTKSRLEKKIKELDKKMIIFDPHNSKANNKLSLQINS